VEEGLRILGVKRWRSKTLEKEEWTFVIKEKVKGKVIPLQALTGPEGKPRSN
jgi:hypothetical protein